MPDAFRDQGRVVTICLVILTTIATFGALKFTQSLTAPFALGLVVSVVFSPIVRILKRKGIPAVVSAVTALLTAVAVITALLMSLGPILSELSLRLPKLQREIQSFLQELSYSLRGLDTLTEEIEHSISDGGGDAMRDALPGIMDALWIAPNFMAQLLIFAGTLFFFLLTRDDLYGALPKRTMALQRADRAVSHYFTTITAINAGLGLLVFGVMTIVGMQNPVIWGMAAFLLNFVLYLGPLAIIAALLVAGLTQFSGLYIFVPALSYLACNLLEAQFVTPSLVGSRLRINPLGVFMAILFGLWLWGPIGGIVALPVLVWVSAFALPPDPGSNAATQPA